MENILASGPIKLWVNKRGFDCNFFHEDNRVFIESPFSKALIAEIKCLEGRKWHGFIEGDNRKLWSFPDTQRNRFAISFMAGKKPYGPYTDPLLEIKPQRSEMRAHQVVMLQHIWTRRHCIVAGEMGVGKTLSMIEAMELAQIYYGYEDLKDFWYIAPKSVLWAIQRELDKWEVRVGVRLLTYESLQTTLREWNNGRAPRFVIYDESSKIKNRTAKRSQAAKTLADAVRDEYGRESFIVEASGTPAPRTPVDWWHQCEIACPGYLREPDDNALRRRLSIVEQRENLRTGGLYPHHVAWLDDDKRCATCGEYKEHENHVNGFDPVTLEMQAAICSFRPSTNEIQKLYRRMTGLVHVLFKSECTNLPEKTFEVIRVAPTVAMLRAQKLILSRATRAIQALTMCRELSDGFQYAESVSDEYETCPLCNGSCRELTYEVDPDGGDPISVIQVCSKCDGGRVLKTFRETIEIGSPKDAVFCDLLDEHEDIGRLVSWAGFTASIDRIIVLAHRQGWDTFRLDGRGPVGERVDGTSINTDELFSAMDRSDKKFDALREKYPKLCFIGQPMIGLGLTLTGSPTAVYYSNCFSGEGRWQSLDRIHRMGMDENRACRIIDLVCLATDDLVLNNLTQKQSLQTMTMVDLRSKIDTPI